MGGGTSEVGGGTSEVGGWTSELRFRDYFKVDTLPVSGRGYFRSGVLFEIYLKNALNDHCLAVFFAKMRLKTRLIHLFNPNLELKAHRSEFRSGWGYF
ncbi:hypothetical protein COR50_10830 [Chitinophaga caeni]|uniref:Uncharacterized protein n=1 Tax=Chitinophaga caeni TaxID=2029983 RepID=A0A291QUB2_9BACT|nr:hypothetical protein COR50_10830 [Chitinophaga caeni]